jgi:predicted nucleotidyltransferase
VAGDVLTLRFRRQGEARLESDLDLLVDFEPGASVLDHVGLCHDLEELLGVGVDIVTRSALKPRDETFAPRPWISDHRGVADLLGLQ